MKFQDYRISPIIKKNIEKLGFKRPTDIQYKAIPSIKKGEDVLAIAQTGTGKTAAFAIPIIDKLDFIKRKGAKQALRGMVMVPTRELALQIAESFNKLEKGTKVKTISIFGGMDQDPQKNKLAEGVDIIVATPGRFFDLVSQGDIKLDGIEQLVLDEADHMLDLGFYDDIKQLISYLPKKRQTLFFSATIDEKIKKLAYSLVNKPVRIQISPKNPVSKNVNHSVAFVKMDDKRFFLERLITENIDQKILVFVRTKVRAERVMKAMERVDLKALTIHGDKDQKERLGALAEFKSGTVKVLIATDVSARGIDIPNVEYVVNYDIPAEPENYVHRVGRTGRGRNKGEAIAFCSPDETALLEAIEDYTGSKIQVLKIDSQDYSETLEFTEEKTSDLQGLINEIEALENQKKKKKRKKR